MSALVQMYGGGVLVRAAAVICQKKNDKISWTSVTLHFGNIGNLNEKFQFLILDMDFVKIISRRYV